MNTLRNAMSRHSKKVTVYKPRKRPQEKANLLTP